MRMRTSDKLPKIAYKNEPKQTPALVDGNLSFQPATRQVHLTEQPLPRKYKVQSSGRGSNAQERSTSTNPADTTGDYGSRRTNIFQVHPHHVGPAPEGMFGHTQSTTKLDA